MSFAVAHPDRVSHLVVLNSFPFFKPQVRLRLAVGGLTVIPWKTMELVRRVTAFRLHSRHTAKPEMRRFLELTTETTKAGYINRLRILMRYDVRTRLSTLQVPTLFLAADRDRFVPSVEQAGLMEKPDSQRAGSSTRGAWTRLPHRSRLGPRRSHSRVVEWHSPRVLLSPIESRSLREECLNVGSLEAPRPSP